MKSISSIPVDNNYVLIVELPEGLKTNYNINLKFSQEMQGTADIITDDVRLLERLIKPMKSSFSFDFK